MSVNICAFQELIIGSNPKPRARSRSVLAKPTGSTPDLGFEPSISLVRIRSPSGLSAKANKKANKVVRLSAGENECERAIMNAKVSAIQGLLPISRSYGIVDERLRKGRLARRAGFEPATNRLTGERPIGRPPGFSVASN